MSGLLGSGLAGCSRGQGDTAAAVGATDRTPVRERVGGPVEPDGRDGEPAGRDGPAPDPTEGPNTGPSVGPSPSATGPAVTAPDVVGRVGPGFAATSAAMARRVGTTGGFGYMVVVQGGIVVHEEAFGGMSRDTAIPTASTAKLLTAILVMTLVDDGTIGLDDRVGEHLPAFASGERATVTVRQLLTHTSGVRDDPCLWATGGSSEACVKTLAGKALQFPPGSAFSYGNGSYHVAGRLVEEMTDDDFVTAFRTRVGEPLGFTGTTWPGAGANPSPAAGATISVHDTLRVLEMLAGNGTFRGRLVLRPESVAEIQRNQVADHDTSGDYAVGITRIPRYGLGVWLDQVDADGRTVVLSGNGALGYYPWIDHGRDAYGIVAVNDQRGAELAVPASRVVIDALLADLPDP